LIPLLEVVALTVGHDKADVGDHQQNVRDVGQKVPKSIVGRNDYHSVVDREQNRAQKTNPGKATRRNLSEVGF